MYRMWSSHQQAHLLHSPSHTFPFHLFTHNSPSPTTITPISIHHYTHTHTHTHTHTSLPPSSPFRHPFFQHLVTSLFLIMDVNKVEGKKRMAKEKVKKEMVLQETEDDVVDDDEMVKFSEEEKMKKAAMGIGGGGGSGSKKGTAGGGGGSMRCCQADKCTADLTDAKPYHRRHKVCEHHAKAQVVLVGGIRQRFCQQCSRFHELSEFDEAKRSCRRRLAGHNERRRKSSADSHAEGSSRKGSGTQLKELVCGQVDDRGRIQISIQENASYKHFQIR